MNPRLFYFFCSGPLHRLEICVSVAKFGDSGRATYDVHNYEALLGDDSQNAHLHARSSAAECSRQDNYCIAVQCARILSRCICYYVREFFLVGRHIPKDSTFLNPNQSYGIFPRRRSAIAGIRIAYA